MARPPKPLNSSSPAVFQTLQWLRKQGFRPVPLHPQSKAAVNRDYVDPKYNPPPDELWRQRNHGVGVATGPQHGGPVDIDLDCEEAVALAPFFLPATRAVFGRVSKRRSHFLYRVDADTFDKQAFLDPTTTLNATIVEMRGDNGHQTVMPGSLHEDTGEPIEWDEVPFPDVTTVSAPDLIKAVQKLAIAVLLVRHVWADGYHNEPVKHLSGLFYYLGWKLEEAEHMVTSLMSYSGDADKSRIPTVRATYRRGEAGKKISGAGVLRRQLNDDRVVDRLLEWAGSQTVNVVQEYNDRFAVVQIGGKYRIADTDVKPGEPPIFLAYNDFLNFRTSDFITIDGKDVPKARVWLKSPQHREYRRVDFLPGVEDDADVLNLWTGWAVLPSDDGSCDAWLQLLRDVICGGDEALNAWMLTWFANILREPMRKPPTAPVIIGEQGAAKTIMVKYFGRILGRAYIPVTNEQHIYGHFNSHLATTLLLHSEEALYAGDRRHRGIVKSLISDEFCALEKKGVDVERTHSYLRLILTSNEDYAAPAEASERRYTVINMRERRADDDLIARVGAELDDGSGPAALHRYLLALPYDYDLIRANVKNDDLAELKAVNMDPVQNWWYGVLCTGALLPDNLAWAQENPSDVEKADWPSVVGIPALYLSFIFKLRERGMRSVASDTAFGIQMRKFLGRPHNKSRRQFSNPRLDDVPMEVKNMDERQNVWTNVPGLDDCRASFERHMKQKLEWPDDGPRRLQRESDKF